MNSPAEERALTGTAYACTPGLGYVARTLFFVCSVCSAQSPAEMCVASAVYSALRRAGANTSTTPYEHAARRDLDLTLACVLDKDSNRALQQLLSVSNTCSGQVLDFSWSSKNGKLGDE